MTKILEEKMKYPYFINPDVEALAEATGEERLRLMRHIAACVGDEATLRTILGIDPEEFRSFYPDMTPPELSTEDTISTFIDKFSSEKKAETPEIEEIIAAPAMDYASMLEQEEESAEAPEDSTSDIISSFLESVPPKTPRRRMKPEKEESKLPGQPEVRTPAVESEDSDLSEALFKLMVKNKNYTKALEIINELSLKNPKKSIYFAYQTRFLEKLIKNERFSRPNQ